MNAYSIIILLPFLIDLESVMESSHKCRNCHLHRFKQHIMIYKLAITSFQGQSKSSIAIDLCSSQEGERPDVLFSVSTKNEINIEEEMEVCGLVEIYQLHTHPTSFLHLPPLFFISIDRELAIPKLLISLPSS